MLKFIIGRKNSGKTTAAHKILGEKVQSGSEAMLIVPKHYTFESDKSILSLLGPKAASDVEVLSFKRLSHIVLSTFGGIKKPIVGNTSRLIYMSLAIEELEDKLKVFKRHKNDIALVTKLLSFVDDMKKEGITADALEKTAEDITDSMLREKIREVCLIYRTYEAVISEGAFDDADLLSRVYDIIATEDFFRGKTIVIDGFPSFTFDELKLISLMLRSADDVYITLCLDKIDISACTGPFPYIQQTARKLMRIAGNNGIEVGEPVICGYEKEFFSEDIEHLEKNLYNPLFTPCEKKSENITVITAADFYDECDAVARRIKALIREGSYRCRDIAVVFRDDEKYEKQLRLSFRKYGIPFFEDKRQETVNQPLISFVRSLLTICADGFDSDSVFSALKTSVSGISTEETAKIENYCFMWDITGKKWLREWTDNPGGFGEVMSEKRIAELEELNKLREKIVTPVLRLREKLDGATGKQAVKALYEYLRENKTDENLKSYALSLEKEGYTELAVEQEQIWDILMEAFDDMASALGDRRVKEKRLLEIFILVISEKTLGKLPDGFDEVSIVNAERMLTGSAKAVFAVGLISGLFPKNQSESGLFSFAERGRIEKTGLYFGEGIKDKSLKERFILYNTLSSAKEKLFLSYCVTGEGSEKKNKSEGITLTEKIIPELTRISTGEESTLDRIESEKSAFQIMAEKYRESSMESDSLYTYFAEKKDYGAVLDSIGRAVYKEPYEFENEDTALKLFGKDLFFSPTQMETYSKCPFMYYCRYGVRAKPRVRAQLDASLSGTVIHHVLEIVLDKYKGAEFLRLTDEEARREIRVALTEYMEDKMSGGEDRSARFSYIYARLLKVIYNIVDRLRSEFQTSDFEPCAFELPIGGDGIAPVTVALEKGSIQINGSIDRVDKMDLDGRRFIRVVDYKTGGKDFELSEVLQGLNMQMLLYLVSLWRNGTGEYENIIPAGVLYFPAKMNTVKYGSRESDREIRREARYKAGKMNGMILSEYDMVSHMDREGRGLFIPVTVDKRNGKISGKFIDLATLSKLGEKMDEIIKNTGDSIHSGIVHASPVCGSNYTDVCAWCDYAEVCMEENPQMRYFRKLPHNECADIIRGEGEEEENEQKLD